MGLKSFDNGGKNDGTKQRNGDFTEISSVYLKILIFILNEKVVYEIGNENWVKLIVE